QAPPTTDTLSLHDALPIYARRQGAAVPAWAEPGRHGRVPPGGAREGRDHLSAIGVREAPDRADHAAARTVGALGPLRGEQPAARDRKSTRLNSSHVSISYA